MTPLGLPNPNNPLVWLQRHTPVSHILLLADLSPRPRMPVLPWEAEFLDPPFLLLGSGRERQAWNQGFWSRSSVFKWPWPNPSTSLNVLLQLDSAGEAARAECKDAWEVLCEGEGPVSVNCGPRALLLSSLLGYRTDNWGARARIQYIPMGKLLLAEHPRRPNSYFPTGANDNKAQRTAPAQLYSERSTVLLESDESETQIPQS